MSNELQEIFAVTQDEAALRLDKLLSLHFPEYSRTYFQFLIEQGCILVNGKQLKKREKPHLGDEVEVCFQLTPEIPLQAESIPLDILFEDEDLIVVNKPASMVVHPGPGHAQGTFVNALLYHCKNLESQDPLRPGIVHRLDKDTSGVLIAAKTSLAHAQLVKLFAERKMQKTYLALCVGTPKEGLIDVPIGRHPIHRQRMSAASDRGKEAKTRVRVLAKTEQLSFVELDLLTGRTHQIRVHLQHIGAPVLGDAIYGAPSANQRWGAERQLLHASRLVFPHPIHGKIIDITAPLPTDMQLVIDNLCIIPPSDRMG